MSIEQPYYPSEEEYKSAQDNLTEEQIGMSIERERESKSEVINVLSSGGFEDIEAKSTLIRWVENKEHEVRLANSNPSRAQIGLRIEIASVYKDAGHSSVALDELESMEEPAMYEDPTGDLYYKIKDMENEILGGIGEN